MAGAERDARSDPRVPTADMCVTRNRLDHFARSTPDKLFAVFENGGRITYAGMRALVVRTAAGLQRLGVKQNEHVLCWLPNGLDGLRVWFALNYLGAVFVPINLAYKGRLLAHVVALSDARLIVCHADLCSRLADIDRALLDTAIVLGGEAEAIPGLRLLDASALAPTDATLQPLERPIAPWDTQAIIYTSGTTGPSKAVLSSYVHFHELAGPSSWKWVNQDDRFMINLPLFHVGGLCCVYTMLVRGGSIAMVDQFSTDRFWDTVKATGTTAVGLMGVMAPFLEKAVPSPRDRGHGLRLAVMIPLCGDVEGFARRFGVEVYTVYNMTEIATPLISGRNPTMIGTCGQPRPGVDIRLVDENDCEVAVGAVGEMILRSDVPWGMNHGYYKNPEATARAWRNGWFHTGDAFRRDAENNYFFVDRMKDAIRRRGENISSFELEADVGAHPAVREVAAIPVPSDLAEDEVMVVVAPVEGAVIDPAELIAFLAPRVAHFMMPRYVRIVPELPKTPTGKVQKHLLRADGITADTFDRDAAGIRIRRERIGALASR